MSSPRRAGLTLALGLALASAACATAFHPARLTEPAVGGGAAAGAPLRVEVRRVLVSEDVLERGVGADTALAVELDVANGGQAPYIVSAAAISCLMELDAARPGETRSLIPVGGGEGPFPGGSALDEPQLGSVAVPPGGTRAYWVLFRGYVFAGSDVPRKITLTLPDARGRRIEVVLADPARGGRRWEVEPRAGGWRLGVVNTTLLGGQLTGAGLSTEVSYLSRLGPLLWDVGISSMLLVQRFGALESPTSAFMASGITAHLALPVVRWGTWQDPRALDLYGGGGAHFLVAVLGRQAPDEMTPPNIYGGLAFEAGLQLDIGSLPMPATPFPLAAARAPLPRWSLRVGYVHWGVGGTVSGGYTTSVQLAW